MRRIKITCRDFSVGAVMLDVRPVTAMSIWEALPLEADAEIWKEEVYFEIPTKIEPESPTPRTSAGDVSYWPEGPGFCIFFGKSQPISPVNTFARIEGGIEKFRSVKSGDRIKVERF
ncbi:MAG: cyclophilin-like fold protein [Candidatus Hadarchaeales archaeon]